MADSSEASITIDASPERVLAAIADFDRYPEWARVKSATVVEAGDAPDRPKQVRLVVDQGVVKDDYTLAYEWSDTQVRWHLVTAKMQKKQDGSYTLAPEGSGTTVTYRLSVDLAVPMIGMLKRRAEKTIMETALKDLKAFVERQG